MLRHLLVLWLLLIAAVFPRNVFAQTATQAVFPPDPSAFPNPERGFFMWTDFNRLNFSRVRTSGYTLTRPYIRLDAYRNSPLPQSLLTQINAGFAEARRIGIKVIPRFSYNYAVGDADASTTQILMHLQQLTPVLSANEDVIALVEAGFIGAWGEWHDSTAGNETAAAESAVLNGLISAVPVSRMISLRYPADLRRLQVTGPITAAEAFTGTLRARLGSHQDCFLASNDDWGTWGLDHDWANRSWILGAYSIAQDKAYIAQNAAYAPVGGETCNVNPPRSDCFTALSELAYLHWSYLNLEFEPSIIQGFRNNGCFDEINRRLGYRFTLTGGSYSSTAKPGENLQVDLQLTNEGYAAMFNARPVFLVLRDGTNRFEFPLSEDPRKWSPGLYKNVSATWKLPYNIPPGTYTLTLWMPDQALTLRDNPLYAVRFANLGVWDAAEGDNVIAGNIMVGDAAISSLDVSPSSIVGGWNAASGTVTLNAPAPTGGVFVALTSSDSAATVPAGITIAEGDVVSLPFTITTSAVSVPTSVTITADYAGSTSAAILTVQPRVSHGNKWKSAATTNAVQQEDSRSYAAAASAFPVSEATAAAPTVQAVRNLPITPSEISALTMESAWVTGGNIVNATITLTEPAPSGGASIAMSATNAAVALPVDVTVAPGETKVVVPLVTNVVGVASEVTISASYGTVAKSLALTVLPGETTSPRAE